MGDGSQLTLDLGDAQEPFPRIPKDGVNGDRVKQARELRAWTLDDLASRVGVKASAISQIESGLTQPTPAHLQAIALQTGFPPAFFRQPTVVDFPLGSLLFRSRSTGATKQRSTAHAFGRIVYELAELLLIPRMTNILISIPRLREDPQIAAQITRSALGLSPDTPIGNLTLTLERHGVLALALPMSLPGVDAFSLWASSEVERPVTVLMGDAPGDRLRFSIAHELGHLVLHRTLIRTTPVTKTAEEEANRFAAEFLLPTARVQEELVAPVRLEHLARLKQRWGVSIQALIERTYSLDVISDRQRSYLYSQMATRGWRTREPHEIPIEKPRALRKMVEKVYGVEQQGHITIDYERLAADMRVTVPLAKQIVNAHAERSELMNTARNPSTLRLIKAE